MSYKKGVLYASNPQTNRGQSTKLSGTKDGRIVYTNGRNVIIRDINNPTLAMAYSGHVHPVNVARISPSGFYCASGDTQGNVQIWDTSYLKLGNTPFPPTSLEPPTMKAEYKPLSGRILDIAWDSESKRLIAVGESRDKFGAAFMLDTGGSAGEVSGHSKVVNAVSIKSTRPFKAVSAGDDAAVVFMSGVPFKFEKAIKTHSRFVQDVQYSPNGELFASVGSDYKVFIYDGKTGDVTLELSEPHKGTIFAIAWSPDSKTLVTASADCSVKLWDVTTGKSTHSWSLGNGVSYQQVGATWVGESNDTGIVSLSMNGDLNVFDKRQAGGPVKTLYGSQKTITAASISPDGTLFAGSYDGRVTVYDPQGNATRFEDGAGHGTQITSLTGDGFSVGYDDKLREVDFDGKAFGTVAYGLESQPKGLASSGVTAFALTEKGVQVVKKGGKEVFKMPLKFSAASIAVTDDGKTVAIGSEDTKVYLYDWTGSELKSSATLDTNRASVGSLAFAPDGIALAAGDATGKIVLYDVKERKMLTTRWSFHSGRITSLAWSSDSQYCVSGSLDTHVYVWSRARPMRKVEIKNAVPGGVNVVLWKEGDREVVAAGADGCVRSWIVTLPA